MIYDICAARARKDSALLIYAWRFGADARSGDFNSGLLLGALIWGSPFGGFRPPPIWGIRGSPFGGSGGPHFGDLGAPIWGPRLGVGDPQLHIYGDWGEKCV